MANRKYLNLQTLRDFSAALAARTITEKSMQVDTVNSGTVQRDAERVKETIILIFYKTNCIEKQLTMVHYHYGTH
jgi:hypothetical protein